MLERLHAKFVFFYGERCVLQIKFFQTKNCPTGTTTCLQTRIFLLSIILGLATGTEETGPTQSRLFTEISFWFAVILEQTVWTPTC